MERLREDPWEVLGVPRGASLEEISHRYRILTHIFHPDRFQTSAAEVREEAERRMKSLNVAYDALKRGQASFDFAYDAYRRAERDAQERAEREARYRAQREARARAERQARERAEREAREREARERADREEREARERGEREARERANRQAWERARRDAQERAERVRERVERELRDSATRWSRERYNRQARTRSEREARERAERESRERRARRVRVARRAAIAVAAVVAARVTGLAIAGVSGPSPTPPPVTVRALDAAPTDTGLDVQPGQLLTFVVAGTWCSTNTDPARACGTPEGVGPAPGNGPQPLAATSPVGRLVARAGDGPWFDVGGGGDRTMTAGGRLVLVFNDAPCCYADNTGEVEVRITTG
jgi:curved DNA-binding protein CbpA